MNQEELDKILNRHKKWLNDEDGGERANLWSANLRSADLRNADLRSANLRNADLRNADLRNADLRSAYLIYIVAPIWNIYINRETTSIGCETHTNEAWRDFDDDRIASMDSHALKWWKIHKPMVLAAMDAVMAQEEKHEPDN